MRRRLALPVLCLLAISALLACSSATHGPLLITIDKSTVLVSNPVHIVVSGLDPGEAATLALSTTDAGGYIWSSSASFKADANGQIDPSRATPSGGSYSEQDGMGLFRSMKPTGRSPLPTFLRLSGVDEFDKIVLRAGSHEVTQRLVRQFYGPGVVLTRNRTPADTFYGDYFSPADVSTRKPGVLIFGGSEGGLSGTNEAEQLASLGYPALAVAYFAEPGLPANLLDVPLEYFVGALTWLSRQPGVDPSHMVVYGVSRGSEAALLLGADFPDLVHGVVALVPSAWVNCSFPICTGSGWSLKGQPIPFDGPAAGADALIPVAKIDGPIFIDCGDDDAVWTSCQYSNRIKAELATGFPYQHPILEFPDAGHGIGSIVPYLSYSEPFALQGRTPSSNQLARESAWPQLMTFLAGVARS
jgi:dienelactone hydrolase